MIVRAITCAGSKASRSPFPVVGPYTSVNCTLRLTKSTVRTSPLLNGGKYLRQGDDFPTDWAAFVKGDSLKVRIRKEHFPYFVGNALANIDSTKLYADSDGLLTARSIDSIPGDLVRNLNADEHCSELSLSTVTDDPVLTRTATDVLLVMGYSLKPLVASP